MLTLSLSSLSLARNGERCLFLWDLRWRNFLFHEEVAKATLKKHFLTLIFLLSLSLSLHPSMSSFLGDRYLCLVMQASRARGKSRLGSCPSWHPDSAWCSTDSNRPNSTLTRLSFICILTRLEFKKCWLVNITTTHLRSLLPLLPAAWASRNPLGASKCCCHVL